MSVTRLSTGAAAWAMTVVVALPLPALSAEAMRVVRDPQTGELRGPTAAEAAAFKKAEEQLRAGNRSRAASAITGPQEITYPDGTVEMKLDEDTHLYSMATLAADGSVRTHCLPAREARALLKSTSKKNVAAKVAGNVAP